MKQIFCEKLLKELPPVFARREVKKLTGGLVCAGSLRNADSAGTGPAIRLQIGRHTAYERESFVQWLMDRARPQNNKNKQKEGVIE